MSLVDGSLLEEGTGRLDCLEFGLKLFDPPAGRQQRIGLVALKTRSLPGVDQRLGLKSVEVFTDGEARSQAVLTTCATFEPAGIFATTYCLLSQLPYVASRNPGAKHSASEEQPSGSYLE